MNGFDPILGVRTDVGSGKEAYFNNQRPEILARVPKGSKRILDVGCGSGALAAAIKNKCPSCEVVGIEYSQNSVNIAKQVLDNVIQMDLNNISVENIPDNFDVIICADILEHLINPADLLRIIRAKINSDGLAILSIPNIRHWSVLFQLFVNDRFEYLDEGILDRTHIRFFTLTEIRKMLEECGWIEHSVNIVRIVMPTEIKEKLFASLYAFGADMNYAEQTMQAYQYIIDAKPN